MKKGVEAKREALVTILGFVVTGMTIGTIRAIDLAGCAPSNLDELADALGVLGQREVAIKARKAAMRERGDPDDEIPDATHRCVECHEQYCDAYDNEDPIHTSCKG